jgi:7-cyano-7-deazaguanine synthase
MQSKSKEPVIVILSGGQDSTTCLFQALDEHGKDNILALSFDYGQKHAIELDSARAVAKIADVKHEIIDVKENLLSMSPLTNSSVPLEQYENFDQMQEVIGNRRELTFVPMRNTLFLVIAANRAELIGAKKIYIGVCEEDNANYSDCTGRFVNQAEDLINISLGYDQSRVNNRQATAPIRIIAPLLRMSKAQTVRLARTLPGCWEALAYSHTSYDGKYPPTDMNHANVLRAKGFEVSGFPDPLVLRAHEEGLMELPDTKNYDQVRP